MGDLAYIPAVAPSVSRDPNNQRRDALGFTMYWGWPTDYFRYPWRLTSPMEVWKVGNQPMPNARERMRIPKEQKTMWDSGGFMLLQNRFHGTAQEVSEFFNIGAIRGDLCFILDRPPFHRELGTAGHFDVTAATNEEAEDALLWTARNAKRMLETQKGEYDLAMVVHGRTPTEMLRWYRVLDKTGRFDAISFAPKHDFRAQMMAGIMIAEFGAGRPAHILGLSGARALAYSAYISNFYKGRITHDSSAPMIHAQRHTFLMPYQLNGTKINAADTVWPDIPCDCPVCITNGPQQYDEASEEGFSVYLLSLHNLYQVARYVRMLSAVRKDRERLLQMAPRETRVLFDAFDLYREKGLEAFERHLPKLEAAARAEFKGSQMTLQNWEQGKAELCEVCARRGGTVEYQAPYDRTTYLVCAECSGRLLKRDMVVYDARTEAPLEA
jgi:tRNA-guanine family transglycosylase